ETKARPVCKRASLFLSKTRSLDLKFLPKSSNFSGGPASLGGYPDP
ncbi:hypothetical protein CCACVL1_20000, partial [Corchorus capsularis]